MDRQVLLFNGTMFENTIARYLACRYKGAVIIQNRSLYSSFLGKDTQIDLIMVHRRGVFVIEAKNWKRWIKGSYNESMWVGRSSSPQLMKVFSPINQNFVHIRALRNSIRKNLGREPIPFHNIVCLPNGALIDTTCKEVVNLSNLGLLIDSLIIASEHEINVDGYVDDIYRVTCVEKGGSSENKDG